ncbi:MAG: PAS domain-containing sensor histidine kinase [Pseudomonadota bacterium]
MSAVDAETEVLTEKAPDPDGVEDNSASIDLPLKGTRSRRPLTWVGRVAVGLALLSGVATFSILTGMTPIVPSHDVVVTTTAINLAFVVVLAIVVVCEGWIIFAARRRRKAAARLHIQIVGLFCVIAAVPAILLAIIASITLDRGLDRWFDNRMRSIVTNAVTIARAYVRDQSLGIRADILDMSADLNVASELSATDREQFQAIFDNQAILRAVPGAYLIRSDNSVVFTAQTPRRFELRPFPDDAFSSSDEEPVVLFGREANIVSALTKLEAFDNLYLALIKPIDPRVLGYLQRTEAAVVEYQNLEARRYGVQVAFGLMYLGLGLILLLSAIWIGIGFANRLVSPIRRLMTAAEEVAEGNLEVNVPIRRSEGDLSSLSKTFNTMTRQLGTQREALLTANKMLDRRRRFTEAVLSGVTAGVIGITRDGTVTLINRSALAMLGQSQPKMIGKKLIDGVPELKDLISKAQSSRARFTQGELVLKTSGRERTVSIRIAAEQTGSADQGFVVTLDDITELVNAQRGAAWADIARRIAHEIKNPLTPIQLSAERLRRKYGRHIETDRDVFDQCVDTIVRQVGDIGQMVDEFSSFARMPKPTMERTALSTIVEEVVFLMRTGHPDVRIDYSPPAEPVPIQADRRLLTQALTNIIKNAVEAIETRQMNAAEPGGHIVIDVVPRGDALAVLQVTDNGVGLPTKDRDKLLEPYITRREKGTGLGLAIVRKILEDHGGAIELSDAPKTKERDTGARISLVLPTELASENKGSDEGIREGIRNAS